MLVYNQMRKPLYSVKRIGAPVPTVPELYQIHSIIWTLFYCFRKIVYHIQWIQKPGIIQTLSFVVLTFLNSIWQRKDLKNAASLCSPAWVHIIMPTKSMWEAPEMQIPPYFKHTAVVPTVSALEGLHCMYKCNYTVLGVQKNNVLFFCGYFIVVV